MGIGSEIGIKARKSLIELGEEVAWRKRWPFFTRIEFETKSPVAESLIELGEEAALRKRWPFFGDSRIRDQEANSYRIDQDWEGESMTKRKRIDPTTEGLILIATEGGQALDGGGLTVQVTGATIEETVGDWPVGSGTETGVAGPVPPVTVTKTAEGEATTVDAFWALLLAAGYTVW